MADYIVKDTELTSVANAIRTAGGTSSLLTFPNGFANAINNISGGGGGSSDFSTATVTVSLNSQYATYYGAMTGNYPGIGESTQDNISCEQGVNVITAVLYKGKALATFETDGTVNITGAARFASDHFTIIITGDCTITIS